MSVIYRRLRNSTVPLYWKQAKAELACAYICLKDTSPYYWLAEAMADLGCRTLEHLPNSEKHVFGGNENPPRNTESKNVGSHPDIETLAEPEPQHDQRVFDIDYSSCSSGLSWSGISDSEYPSDAISADTSLSRLFDLTNFEFSQIPAFDGNLFSSQQPGDLDMMLGMQPESLPAEVLPGSATISADWELETSS
jgi:hypothetical protein